ncbi:hypothetical protein [Thaumasiovibrio sp. DFM-14]|uniref:hypothetical protein n=1 Tax=Thaumasiovibrio sp. DFM-14 TaxID=3384792 RepID=UPI0039A025D5
MEQAATTSLLALGFSAPDVLLFLMICGNTWGLYKTALYCFKIDKQLTIKD